MNKIGICLLGYGDEHIKECNSLIDKLSKFKNKISIYVGTDSVEKISKNADKIINIIVPFNYNLKRISVREALKDCNIIILMDSDIILINSSINFSDLNNIEDGIYSYFVKKNYKRDYNIDYQRIIYNYNNNRDLHQIHEFFMILKMTDEQKKIDFIYNWDTLYEITEGVQPIAFNGNHGSQEGLILYVSGIKSGIKCFDISDNENINIFVNSFHHYHKEKDIKHKITLI
jgi:hypothetical protein